MLSEGSSSCGPSNPLQSFGKHVSRETVANQDRIHRQQNDSRNIRSISQDPKHVVAQFNEFSRSSPQFNIQSPSIQPPTFQSQEPAFNQYKHRSADNSQWISEFAGISIKERENVLKNRQNMISNHPMNSMGNISSFPTIQHSYSNDFNTFPQFNSMSEHQQIHHVDQLNEKFDEAFHAIETSLAKSTDAGTKPASNLENIDAETSESLEKDNTEQDLAGIARNIVHNVNNNSTEQSSSVADKMQKSQFFNLMNKISAKQVILQGEEFIEQNTGSKVNVMEMAGGEQEKAEEGQEAFAREGRKAFTREGQGISMEGQGVSTGRQGTSMEIPESTRQIPEQSTSTENRQDVSEKKYQSVLDQPATHLESPIAVLERNGFKFDSNTEYTPFNIAKQMIPEMTSTEWWEEKYQEDDSWVE